MGYILVCSIHLKSLCVSLSLEKKKREGGKRLGGLLNHCEQAGTRQKSSQ